ncbi:multidrug effflux MFS transporter [Agaribacter flavus]|uniref:Bcr/CflA family efflux transporter n=1 Tax=Agaribacter flavus TaxID=1902781 RepID=A0ABV7FQI5_9ALTE
MQGVDSISTGSQAKRLPMAEFIVLMALMTALIALSIDAMLPALDVIGYDLKSASAQQNYLIVSLFFAGMAAGQLFFGPFADARGRRLTILLGLVIFILGTAICYFARSIEVLLLGRLIQAFGVSGPRIASMALIRDLYKGDAMARVMSFIMLVFILIPMLAPMIGQVVIQLFGWRHLFTLFALFGVITGIWFFARQGETLKRQDRQRFKWRQFGHSLIWLVKHPVVMGSTIGLGTIFGAFIGYLSASQTIFQHIYDTGSYFPVLFAVLAFSIGIASLVNSLLVMRLGMKKLAQWATTMCIVFSLFLLVCTIVYAGKPPLVLLLITLFIGFFFIGILFGNLNSMAMEPVGHIAGVGAAFIGSFSSIIAASVGVLISQQVSNSLVPIGVGFTVFSTITFLSVAYAIKKPGQNDRAKGA